MTPEMITVLVSGGTAVVGSLITTIWTVVKYRDAKKKEKEAEEKEFYLFTASNLIREAERMFGDAHGEEKKLYTMTRLQNEAISSKVTWNPKLASMSVEQAVALRNDYKNMDIPMSEIIKKENTSKGLVEEAEKDIKKSIDDTISIAGTVTKKILNKTKAKPEEESVITVEEN